MYPPALVLTRAKFWFRGHKCGNTGSPCLDKPVLPHGTYHGTLVADISQPSPSKHDDTSNSPAHTPRTQEHMELQPHQHFATHMDPSCSPHNATHHILCWIGTEDRWFQKRPKSAETRDRRVWTSPCRDKGGGG